MPQYLFLFHETPETLKALSPEEMQAIVQKFRAWRARLAERGAFLAGQKLRNDGKVLRTRDGEVVVTDGPYSEAKEILAGFFLVEAASDEEAIEFASWGPHVARGAVEVRQIDAHG